MGNETDIQAYIAVLDAQRATMGMSYQDVADACDVSKATVYRALCGKTEPTMALLQNIAAAVQYKPEQVVELPDEITQDAYISYLKQLIRQKDEEINQRAKQLHAHYNKLLRQKNREKTVWVVLTLLLSATFIVLFLYDFTHLDRGWIQMHAAGLINAGIKGAMLAVRQWIAGIL